jgi:hypothetical protein
VQAVSADDQVKAAWRSAVEDHIDATSIGMKLGDHLIEQEFSVSAARFDQDLAEIGPGHFDLAI